MHATQPPTSAPPGAVAAAPPGAPRPLRVLVVNDQELWFRSFDSILGPAGCTVLRVPTGRQAVEQLADLRPDVLLIHSHVRDTGGSELCRHLRQNQLIDPATPVIITTLGPCTREERLAALRAGAWECFSLPLDPEALLLKLQVYAGAKRDADRAREDGLVDPPTGLYNLPGVLRRTTELGGCAVRYEWAFACVAIAPDLPGEGVAEGDAARLRATVEAVAQVLTSVARRSDVIGRIGRTELVILAPETDAAGATELARRLVAALDARAEEQPGDAALRSVRLGCYGVANFARAGIEPVEMIVRASLALRQAQEDPAAGRVRFFEPVLPPPLAE